MEAKLLDDAGVSCLDSRQLIRFELAGDGMLIDNLGTSTGSRAVQMYNGRALISLKTNRGQSLISVSSEALPTAFLKVS